MISIETLREKLAFFCSTLDASLGTKLKLQKKSLSVNFT